MEKKIRKANGFEKFVKKFRIDNDLSSNEMAHNIGITYAQLHLNEKLSSVNMGVITKILDYMKVTEEEEEYLSSIIDTDRNIRKMVVLSHLPDHISIIINRIADSWQFFGEEDINNLNKLLGVK